MCRDDVEAIMIAGVRQQYLSWDQCTWDSFFRQDMITLSAAQSYRSVTESLNVEKRRAGWTEPRTSPSQMTK